MGKKKKLKRSLANYKKVVEKCILPIDERICDQFYFTKNAPNELLISCNDGGVHFGRDPFEDSQCYVGKRQEDDGHILVVGTPGCHKTTGIILPSILTWKGTFMAVDIKGDISDFCIRNGQKNALQVMILDFASDETEVHFDPFLLLRKGGKGELISNARELALSIIPTPNDIREPFWIQGAQNILTAIILYAVGNGMNFNQTIEMTLTTSMEEIHKAILGSTNLTAKAFISQYSAKCSSDSDDKTLRGSFVELANHLHDFFHPQVQNIFSAEGNILDLERDVNRSNFVIHLPESKINQWSGAVRLILRQLFTVLSNRPDKYSSAGRCLPPFLLLWDEMPRFGKFEDLTQMFSILRSRGVTICAALQSFAQIDNIYGPAIRRVLVDCCSYLVIGAVQDAETQRLCSEIVGTTPIWEPGISESYYLDRREFSFGRSLNCCREPIIFPEDFATSQDFIIRTPFGIFRTEKEPIFQPPGLLQGSRYSRLLPEHARNSTREDETVNFHEILEADIARYEKAHAQFSSKCVHDEQVKTDVDPRRSKLIGEMMIKYFPELKCFRPQLNQAANEIEFKPLEEFLAAISKYKPVQNKLLEVTQKENDKNNPKGDV